MHVQKAWLLDVEKFQPLSARKDVRSRDVAARVVALEKDDGARVFDPEILELEVDASVKDRDCAHQLDEPLLVAVEEVHSVIELPHRVADQISVLDRIQWFERVLGQQHAQHSRRGLARHGLLLELSIAIPLNTMSSISDLLLGQVSQFDISDWMLMRSRVFSWFRTGSITSSRKELMVRGITLNATMLEAMRTTQRATMKAMCIIWFGS